MSNSTMTTASTSLSVSTVLTSSIVSSTVVSTSDILSTSVSLEDLLSTTIIPTATLDPTDTEILLAPTGDANEDEAQDEGEGESEEESPNGGGGGQRTYTSYAFVTPVADEPTGTEENPAPAATLDSGASANLSVGGWMVAVLGFSALFAGLL